MSDLFELTPPPSAGESGAKLNAEQRAAVRHGEGPLLVVAGAGTGKTRVITERIRHLLESDPDLPGESILGLTFTDKAAARDEAPRHARRGRARPRVFPRHVPRVLQRAADGTQSATRNPGQRWTTGSCCAATCACWRSIVTGGWPSRGSFWVISCNFSRAARMNWLRPDDYERYVAALAEAYRARARSAARRRTAAARGSDRTAAGDRARLPRQRPPAARAQPADVWHAVARRRARAGRRSRLCRRSCATRFRYILVDEFQDTNVAQIELLWRLAGDHRNIVAVGDNAQAIYRFRGASFGSFTIFLERFAGVPRGDRRAAARFMQPLVDNYRSTGAHSARGRAGHQLHRTDRRWCPRKSWCRTSTTAKKYASRNLLRRRTRPAGSPRKSSGCTRAGPAWRSFAALYRIHAHRNALVEALERARHSLRDPQPHDPRTIRWCATCWPTCA